MSEAITSISLWTMSVGTPVIVRVQVFASDQLASITGDAWQQEPDGWWCYTKILEAGAQMPAEDELYAEVKERSISRQKSSTS